MKIISLKKILPVYIIIIAVIIFIPQTAKAELGDLDVVFSQDPLFQEISILPGDDASETITVTNNTDEEKTIGIEFIGTSTHELDEMIYFTIKENGNVIFGGSADPKTLAELLNLGEINLTNLLSNSATTMDISAEFDFKADNPYQLKASIFDIKVGFIYFESNPKILGDETEIKYPIETKKPIVLGVELPVTGGQLLLILIVALILLLVSIYSLKINPIKKDSETNSE